jgi:hypothetical protein
MVALWSPSHLGQPTSTRATVGLPPTSVVSHVLAAHSVFGVASVENLGGTVVMVEDIESVVVIVSTVGSIANTNSNAVSTIVGMLLEPIVKGEKVKGGGIITLEGGRGARMITTPLHLEAHKFRQGQIDSIVRAIWPSSSVLFLTRYD